MSVVATSSKFKQGQTLKCSRNAALLYINIKECTYENINRMNLSIFQHILTKPYMITFLSIRVFYSVGGVLVLIK